jgi:hypothetical protein
MAPFPAYFAAPHDAPQGSGGASGFLPASLPYGAGFLPGDPQARSEGGGSIGMGLFEAGGAEAAARHFGASYSLLERQRPDVASVARFAHRIEVATFYMCVAFEYAGVREFEIEIHRMPRRDGPLTWLGWLVETTFQRFTMLRRALMHNWTPPVEVEPLTYSAFQSLCELTPSGHHLKQLFVSRRAFAIEALVNQLDLIAKVVQDTAGLASDAENLLNDRSTEQAAARLASNQAEVIAQAGEALGLREAARRLSMSHQNLHKRIAAGSALGVMRGRELIVPSIQFVASGDGEKIVPNLRNVLGLFKEARAGNWSALQFLVEEDPRLGGRPIEALKAGEVEWAVAAARAYLGLDEA